MDSLPNEILVWEIASRVSLFDLLSLRFVNKRWAYLTVKEALWTTVLHRFAHHTIQNVVLDSVKRKEYWFIALQVVRQHCDKRTLVDAAYQLMDQNQIHRALSIARDLYQRFNDYVGLYHDVRISFHLRSIVGIIKRIDHSYLLDNATEIVAHWRSARNSGMPTFYGGSYIATQINPRLFYNQIVGRFSSNIVGAAYYRFIKAVNDAFAINDEHRKIARSFIEYNDAPLIAAFMTVEEFEKGGRLPYYPNTIHNRELWFHLFREKAIHAIIVTACVVLEPEEWLKELSSLPLWRQEQFRSPSLNYATNKGYTEWRRRAEALLAS